MGLSNREFIGRALDIMAEGLEPVIRATMDKAAPGIEWPRILEHKDELQHRESKRFKATDPQVQLRMLTERLGGLGFPFDLSPEARAYAGEMRQVRNLWAHNEPFTDDDVQRYIDTSRRLLQILGAEAAADRASSLLVDIKKRALESEPGESSSEPGETEESGTLSRAVQKAADVSLYTLSFDSAPELSYAMAYNGQRIISRLTITNDGPEIRGAVLKLRVTGTSGLVTRPSEHYLDIPANQTVTIAEPELQADPAVLLQLQDRQPGAIEAHLEVDGELLAQQTAPIELLAAHHWRYYPGLLTLESLAALVQPNHPAVATLCSEASDALLAATGSGSLEGYQAGPERTDQIADALAQALRNRDVRYSEPPASWGQGAQRVRNADEVLNGRFGTCLDTVVVLAAAMEFAGLQANLWLVQGHIFLGYWRDQANFKTPAVEDPASLINAIDLNRIRLIETTLLTDAKQHSMQELHERPYARWLTGDLNEVLGVVDLYAARHSGIRPIPVRFTDAAGTVTVVEYTPPRRETPSVAPAQEQRERRRAQRPEPPGRVTQWKNTLLDLSLRNRLINFTATARFPLAVPDAQVGHFEDMLNRGKDIALRPSDEVSAMQAERGVRFGRDLPQDDLAELLVDHRTVFADVTRGAYQTRMRNLAYKAKTLIEETGANNLYLALGSLVWNLEGRELRSPLVLVPVRLRPTAKQGPYQISLDDAGTSTPNYCLLEKLRLSLGLEIPGLAEPAEDDAGIDLDKAFEAVRVAVAEKGLPFRVEPTVDLSILQFAKFRLWKDLDERWEELCKNPLVHHLVHSPVESFTDPVQKSSAEDLDLLATKVPIPADSSQLQAIAEAVAGKTFVLEGPPGTGKSQTITNLLTRAIAEGKRVLFVAEKRAALDVVQKRLDEVGMGVFSLDLHDKGSKPAAVRRQIRQALDHTAHPDRQGLDAALGELNKARRFLVRYASRLHEENGAELSLYSARTQELSIGDEVPSLYVPESFVGSVSLARLQQLRTVLSELPDAAEPAQPSDDHPWGFLDRPLSAAETAAVFDAAKRINAALNRLPTSEALLTVLMAARTVGDFEKFASLLPSSQTVDIDVLDEAGTSRWATATRDLQIHLSAFLAASHPGLDKVVPEILDLPIADIHARAVEAAASGFFGRKKRLIAVRDGIAPYIRPGAEVKPKGLPELTGALMAVQGAVRGMASGATAIPGIELPASWNPFTTEGQEYLGRNVQWLEWASKVLKVPPSHSVDDFVPAMRSFFRAGSSVDAAAVDVVRSLAQALRDMVSVPGVDEAALTEWLDGQQFVTRWEKTGRTRGLAGSESSSLRRWLAFVDALEPLREEGLLRAREELKHGRISADDAGVAFERALAEASQRERADATGLNSFEPRVHERTISRFTTRSALVRRELKAALPDDVLRARTFDADSNAGRMGLLQRQLNYKTGGLRVRALLETHGDLITRIMPCVLVSPDSVARFFPAMSDLFDLVVFDEASQIRVADAVGAMGRGRAVVVVGDSKQMPPTSFAETTTDRDEEAELVNETVEDEESILSECVLARVPRQWLSWHYRSQDESLIAFSNQQYYDNKLSSFPAPVHGPATSDPGGFGINFVRVDGEFHRSGAGKLLRTNPVEAAAVVDEIRRRFDASPVAAPSVGVVTFNLQQRAYIESLLRDTDDPRIAEALDVADGLFVKNLENVQGDERDTILFSTGFSKNSRGALPLNFGPLNRSGGERRLNVAVTRARRQVIVFSSFDPTDLRAEETSSVGIKHLRSYLEIAAHGPSALPFDGRRKPAVDRHREQIADALRERGFAVTTDVGLSDFKVDISVATAEEPNRPLMAVLLDSPAWAARPTVGDRDGLPSDVLLRMLRWPAVERVWLPEWLVDAPAVVDRLRLAMESAGKAPTFDPGTVQGRLDAAPTGSEADELPSSRTGEGHADSPSDAEAPLQNAEQVLDFESVRSQQTAHSTVGSATTYQPWVQRGMGGINVLDTLTSSPRSRALVVAAISQIVDAEWPIHTVRLAKLTCAEFSLNKVNSQRAGAVIRLIDQDKYRIDGGAFVWPIGMYSGSWRAYRGNGPEIDRKIEHVSKVEIANAMVAVCREADGIELEDLKRRVIRVFGGLRVTVGIGELLDEAAKDAQREGKLTTDNGGFLYARQG